ncbi:WD repeat mio family protein [Abortiporus biennis]
MVQAERRLLWHPRLDNKFLVAGGSQITLYEWLANSSQIKHVTSKHDLQTLKCVAWSPDVAFDDLIAVGYGSGKVDLLRLEATTSTSNHVLSNTPQVTLPVRNTRACNALAFCSVDPNYLAVGLDKVRGDSSLIIWDVSTVSSSLSINVANGGGSVIGRPQPQIPRVETGTRMDSRILQQHAPAEVVSSVAFLPKSTSLLAAGVSHRWLRLFDLRSHNPSIISVASKVHGIATDPFDPYRIGCFGDTAVTIWDQRRFTHPLLTFTEKDASADGARPRSNTNYSTIEFSSVRRGLLATLEKDSSHVRFWNLQSSDVVTRFPDGRISRDSSQSSRAIRLSWANPTNMLPWSTPGPSHATPPATPGEHPKALYNLILSDTRKTKNFKGSLSSFALVPSGDPCPLTSNVMIVNKDGDLELYAVHDTPTHTPWSPRGDLAIGIGCTYSILPGFHDREPPPEPWDILMHPAAPHPTLPVDKRVSREQSLLREKGAASPPMFGRGDEDGFPALANTSLKANLAATRPTPQKTSHTAISSSDVSIKVNGGVNRGKHSQSMSRHVKETSLTWGSAKEVTMQHTVETDISMGMRRRVVQGYGLVNPLHNSSVARESLPSSVALSELWLWIHHAQRLLSIPTAVLEGYNFSYQGVFGIWEGFRQMPSHVSANPTPRITHRSLLLDQQPVLGNYEHRARSGSRHDSLSRHDSYRRSRPPVEQTQDDFVSAIVTLNARRDSGKANWRPSAPTAKLAQRQLALHLCGWSLAEDDLASAIRKWEKEHKHSQAACWLVFTKQHKTAVELLMRSKDETHHMMSGMLAALSPSSASSNKNTELREHCERLIVRLQDPYLRAMLTHLIVSDDWTDVLLEDALPLRERLAIAFQFLDDKEISGYLRRTMDRCIHEGDIEGLIVSGLTPHGLEILQAYVDTTGDVQTAAILAALNPSRANDLRTERWLDTYRDLLDQWKLFHYRCQLDIDRGRILQESIQQGEIQPFEWTSKQIVLRCNYCNKPFNSAWPNNPRPTSCQHCGRPLPRCSICLLTLSIVQDDSRNAELANSSSKDTIDEALVFCQTCRHGGHASHILEWFYDEDGNRVHGTCPVANCHCRCADGF